MEINEDHSNENKQRLLIQSSLLQMSQPPLLESGRDAKTGRGEKILMVITRDGFRCALIGGRWHGEAADGRSRSRASCVAVRAVYLAFSGWL